MDSRPIGVFDSGLGGLTAVQKLMTLMPQEDIIYFGDTGRVPYGGRSRETILKYTRQDIAFLQRFDIKAIVVACGTASSNALDELAGAYTVPIFGVVRAAAEAAVQKTKNRKIGVIATAATIRSRSYERIIREQLPEAQVCSGACPLFVPLVENGRIHPGDVVIETVAREYLEPMKAMDVDTLILGCTHYPLLTPVIAEIMGPAVTLISPGEVTAAYVKRDLERRDACREATHRGQYQYYVSDSVESFAEIGSLFLQTDINGEVKRVSVDTL